MKEIIVAVAGILLGVLGLIFGVKKSQKAKDYKEDLEHINASIEATVAALRESDEEVRKIKEVRDEEKPVVDTCGTTLDRLRK